MASIKFAFIFVSVVNGFTTTKPAIKTFRYEGDLEPVGFFDPLQISTNLNEDMTKFTREAELQHGRVAMTSMAILPILDAIDKEHLAINKLSSFSFEQQLPYWIGVGAFEFSRMKSGWENPFESRNAWWKLREDYQPGNVFRYKDSDYTRSMLNKELSNGRLAMIASAGYICQELATNAKCFSI